MQIIVARIGGRTLENNIVASPQRLTDRILKRTALFYRDDVAARVERADTAGLSDTMELLSYTKAFCDTLINV